MARKESVTKEMILDMAFQIAKTEGFENVTARKVSGGIGCSTQPIFRVYENMNELWNAVFEKAVGYFQDYYSLYPRMGKTPFSNLGMAYVSFAREGPYLFGLLFCGVKLDGFIMKNPQSMYEILNGTKGNVMQEINMAKGCGCEDSQDLFMKMWIFIHGIACMMRSGDYDLKDVETMELLGEAYYSFESNRRA